MADSDQLLQRNKDLEAICAHEEASIIARHPEHTVGSDVEFLRSATVLPDRIIVSGHVYDVATGLVTTIIPAATIPPHAQPSPPRPAGRPPRCCCAGACSAVSQYCPSQPTGTGSPRTAGSSTSGSPARNSRNSMPLTAPAAPETLLNAHGGEPPGL